MHKKNAGVGGLFFFCFPAGVRAHTDKTSSFADLLGVSLGWLWGIKNQAPQPDEASNVVTMCDLVIPRLPRCEVTGRIVSL